MPYLTSLIENGTCLLREGKGIVTGQEVLEAVVPPEDIRCKLQGITHSIIDYTHLEEMRISSAEVKDIVERQQLLIDLIGRVFVAVVAPSDLAFGIARMYQAMTVVPDWEIQVFRSMHEAKTWLRSSLRRLDPTPPSPGLAPA